MRVAFIHDWQPDFEQEYTWRDGLAAAIKILSERHTLKFFTCGKTDFIIPHPYFPIHVSTDLLRDVSHFQPYVLIHWADCTRPNAERLASLGKPMALCFAGGATDSYTARFFDHFFVESEVYKERFIAAGKSVSTAFGTNTHLFQPIKQAKIFDAIFPATFCEWKRHQLFAKATSTLKACAVGYIQPHGKESHCWTPCVDRGNLVLPHVSAEALHRLYAASKVCVIPSRSDGGSQRTVLEALAMNIPVVVCEDSDKTTEYIRQSEGLIVPPDPVAIYQAICQSRDKTPNTRDYILKNWSEITYADAINSWITQ